MNGILRNKVAVFVLALTVISVGYIFASDVTVQEGTMTVDSDLTVGGLISGDDLILGDDPYLYFDYDDYYDIYFMGIGEYYGLLVGDKDDSDLAVLEVVPDYDYGSWVNIGTSEEPADVYLQGTLFTEYIGDLDENPMLWLYRLYGDGFIEIGDEYDTVSLGIWGDLAVNGLTTLCEDTVMFGDLSVYGTFYNSASCMYEQKSRDDIITYVKTEVPPDKQSGAAMFFNKDTKKIENYVASEGKFYDTEGNVIYQLDEIVEPTTKYETVYHFDKATGQIISTQKAVADEYRIKTGYSLDSKTGKFVNKENGKAVSREEALEIYAASEGKIYDSDHNFLRNSEKPSRPEVAASDNITDSINTSQNTSGNHETKISPVSLNY